MKAETTGDHRSKAQQGCQIENVRTDYDAGTNRPLMVSKGSDGCSDFWCVSRECRNHSEQRFGETETFANSL